jgi:hypothetical protein
MISRPLGPSDTDSVTLVFLPDDLRACSRNSWAESRVPLHLRRRLRPKLVMLCRRLPFPMSGVRRLSRQTRLATWEATSS